MAQDREQWRSVVNTNEHSGCINCEELLDEFRKYLLKRTFLHGDS
jgi:hypothetical protein